MRWLPPLPRKITISGIEYKIILVNGLYRDDDWYYGILNLRDRTIKIDSGLGRDAQWITLFHEIVHVAVQHHDIFKDEYLIDTVATNAFNSLRQIGLFSPLTMMRLILGRIFERKTPPE